MIESPSEMVDYRLAQLERGAEKLDQEKADSKDVRALIEEVRSLKKILMVTASGVVLAAVTFAFTVAQLHG